MAEPAGRVEALSFDCEGAALAGVLHRPAVAPRQGVLIIVGGPQYRVGSHRQFLLLARQLAAAGYAVLRFDHRGIGDSDGPLRGFQHLEADINAAMAQFHRLCPELRQVYLWGLCDAASAALFHAARHPQQVAGLILLNPWARTERGEAQAYLSHYYGSRLLQVDFWRRLLTGQVGVLRSLAGFVANWRLARPAPGRPSSGQASLPGQLHAALQAWRGPIFLALSGRDLTAREFVAWLDAPAWQPMVRQLELQRVEFPEADHTFSTRRHRDELAAACLGWLRSLPG